MLPDRRYYKITGKAPLSGEVSVTGAKNAITKQLVASLLTTEPCIFNNVPKIKEIDKVLEMLGELGSVYEWLDEHTLKIQTLEIKYARVNPRFQRYNRIPILLLGPLLHRVGRASVPIPGGCKIGSRPVDFHLLALESMGARISSPDNKDYDAMGNGPTGKGLVLPSSIPGQGIINIVLPYPSVGATENIILAAVLAKGVTSIFNAAIEPEVWDTIIFLQKMGAKIRKDGDRCITINGVEGLNGASHHTIPDRIEAASFASLALATNGRIFIRNASDEHMASFLYKFSLAGGGYECCADGMMFFQSKQNIQPVHIETDVHPGFMTDWQQPLAVALTQANGTSVIHETVYEKRFDYTSDLNTMGAKTDLLPFCLGASCRFHDKNYFHSCVISGPSKLSGSKIHIPDLRAGFAYIIAALIAEGTSCISGIEYLERGYANIPEKLAAIGAKIEVEAKQFPPP